jgi:hypothetical protein
MNGAFAGKEEDRAEDGCRTGLTYTLQETKVGGGLWWSRRHRLRSTYAKPFGITLRGQVWRPKRKSEPVVQQAAPEAASTNGKRRRSHHCVFRPGHGPNIWAGALHRSWKFYCQKQKMDTRRGVLEAEEGSHKAIISSVLAP